VTPKSIRSKMRALGLDPRSGKRVLSKTASSALLENSAIMGIEPGEMDLTSPLAYLPMGEELRKRYQDKTLARVTELEPDFHSEVSGNIYHDLHLRAHGVPLRAPCPVCGAGRDDL